MLMSMLLTKLHYFRVPMACLWDTLYRVSHKHAQYMYQNSVICSWACLWPNCIIFVCLSECLWDTLYRVSHNHAQYMYQNSVISSWACLWPNCIIFVCLSACLWDTLYRDSHKHAQYMYQHSVICSWVCLWPNYIIFVCLWRAYETPNIGILISTPSLCTTIL